MDAGGTLIRYNTMRRELETCARIDEAAEIKDKAAALQAYARQRHDSELEIWTAEIKQRAAQRIGELSQDLETAQGARIDLTSSECPEEVQTKEQMVRGAGLSPSTAWDYEQLTGPPEVRDAVMAGTERYFDTCRTEKNPATMDGLRAVVRRAVEDELGPPPAKSKSRRRATPNPITNEWIDWTSAVKHLSQAIVDLNELAQALPDAVDHLHDEAMAAQEQLDLWIEALEKCNVTA
jgi:hypothetical protein